MYKMLNSMNNTDGHSLHIAMLPWLAFGHLIPYLELAKLIAQKGHQISFISTPRNIKRLPKIDPNLSNGSITFVCFNLPRVDDLPEEVESTSDLPYDKVPSLKQAFDKLQENITEYLQVSSPDWILYDFAAYWVAPIAAGLGISRSFFTTFNAWTICFFVGNADSMVKEGQDSRSEPEDYTVSPVWVPFQTNVVFRLHEAKKFCGRTKLNLSGTSDKSRFLSAISGANFIGVKTCTELEADWIQLFSDLHNRPVIPVGLLPPPIKKGAENGQVLEDEAWGTINGWLNTKVKKSVVYVSLGTETSVTQKDIDELALGLEHSGVDFIWAVRNRNIDSDTLPLGFRERVEGRGLVWTAWAPQLKILSHDSVGGFLTHCGWNSVVEGLSVGLPLIMLPFYADQGLVARVFGEKKVGIEIPRDENDGSFTRNEVADSVSLIMVKEEGNEYKENALEISVVFGKNRQDEYVEKFVKYLEDHGADMRDNKAEILSFNSSN